MNATENSSEMPFDSDGIGMFNDDDGGGDDYLNDISIDVGALYAILDEEEQPQQAKDLPQQHDFLAFSESFEHGKLAPSQYDPEHTSQEEPTVDLEYLRERGISQWNLEASGSQGVPEFDSYTQSEPNPNTNIDRRSLHVLPHFDLNNACPTPAQDSPDQLTLPAFGSLAAVNFGQPQLQMNTQEYSTPVKSMKGDGLVLFPVVSDSSVYSNNEEVSKHHELETSFHSDVAASEPNRYISSIGNLQNVEAGLSHYLSMENFDFSGKVQDNSSAFPDSTVEDGNMYSPSVYSGRDADAAVFNLVKPEANNFGASDATYFCSAISGARIGLPQTASAQYQQHKSETLIKRDYHLFPSPLSCRTSEVDLHTKQEYSDNSSLDVSISDLDGPSSDELSTQYHCDEISLLNESSTDSSPITSGGNCTSYLVDRGVIGALKPLRSGWPSKPEDFKVEQGDQLLQHDILRAFGNAVKENSSRSSTSVEDDIDICIIDDISAPRHPLQAPLCAKPHLLPWHPESSEPSYHGIRGMGFRPDDERLTFRLALQDLSQPKSEANPPDGVLAVPLLRHQKIALSWMIQKETASLHCCGGILADDQGLGKTVSTIALILTERSPSSRSTVVKKEEEFEALNLDDDDDGFAEVVNQPHNSSNPLVVSKPTKKNSVAVVKGRPAAGTLIVCPTSVLRQWADELQKKVTSEANLSVLVYHGSNRTKDPEELSKYDVVLTTYSIVTMEVPKQPLFDKDDEEKGRQDASNVSSGLLDSKKRKDPPTSKTKNPKKRSTPDGALLESAARPLGRVGWFRVVLDEAQSIKNHRTQVARACCGLRSKRRWCLSGTPVQNAIDDLFSYFRFLRFDPYAVYNSFCMKIKMPISRNPANGYKKLQAVLKTIMLRRTKGSKLDGEPIVMLPPKTVSLKKVDFSMEELAFYSRLEAESREQFMEYEDAGTVKQNYVNILLMLLRLRQACDHPLLVKGCNSNSSQRSSLVMAKELPREKKIILLSYLEVSLAICTICNDPPEDAVVAICGHVFCNQCICEHLTADENICPSPNCKVQLRASLVFSRGTLKKSLSDELGEEFSGSPGFEMGDGQKKFDDSWSPYSSKIKAALAILQSLPKFQPPLESNLLKYDGEPCNYSVDSNSVEHTRPQRYLNREVSEKAIVFSQWTRMLDLLEGPLKASCIQYRRLDGTMSVTARENAIKDFNTLPEVTVIIMSLKAASLGLNLVAANHVLLLDLWWNPTTEDQAIDRAHRIGQTRPVTVFRLTVNDTVEDKILSLQEKKREMVASAFGEDESGSRQSRLTVEDLRYIFRGDQ